MPAKKKTRSKPKNSKHSAASKRPVKKSSKKKSSKPQAHKTAAKKAARRSTADTTKPKRRKTITRKAAREVKEQVRDKSRAVYETGSARPRQGRVFSGRESGDLEGLSRREEADSESVDELLEEGNSFEAGVVAGVEEADNSDEKEVHTHEVPEDDVPDEYLDPDKD